MRDVRTETVRCVPTVRREQNARQEIARQEQIVRQETVRPAATVRRVSVSREATEATADRAENRSKTAEEDARKEEAVISARAELVRVLTEEIPAGTMSEHR